MRGVPGVGAGGVLLQSSGLVPFLWSAAGTPDGGAPARMSSLSRRNVSASSMSSVGPAVSMVRNRAEGVMFDVDSGRSTSADKSRRSVVLPQRFCGERSGEDWGSR